MIDVSSSKQRKINEIVSVVKLASLLLIGIILFDNIFKKQEYYQDSIQPYYTMIFLTTPLLLLIAIYFMWSFSTKNKIKGNYKSILDIGESIIFIIIFSLIIYLNGSYESNYKFLYLFIIITTTIQIGIQHGIVISCISSVIILCMDIIMIPNEVVNIYFQSDLILVAIFILTAWIVGFYVKIENEHIKMLENIVNIDGLTELYNHKYFHQILIEKIKNAKENNEKVALIFIDIDYFKHYNDLYGHQKGDYVLNLLAQIIKKSVRKTDIAARYGGEEFAVILPNIDESEAIKIAEKIRKNIQSTYFEGEENQPNGRVTSSIGVSIYPDRASNDVELIKSADDALYRAKFFNKNRVEVYSSILDDIKESIEEKDEELVTSIKTLISIINAKDKYTYGHIERVVVYSRIIAEGLNLSDEEKKSLVYGAYLHDIGKINISKEILTKKMKLEDEEWNILKQHPQNGVDIIKPVKSLQDVMPLILSHHERYDGTGYPNGLKGEEIPYLARVLAITDSFDAMTSSRPYNKRKSFNEALKEIERCSGTHFDPKLSKLFVEIITNYSKDALENDIRDIKEKNQAKHILVFSLIFYLLNFI